MSKHKLIRKVSAIAAAVAMLGTLFVPMAAQAAQITSRSVTIGNSNAGATTTNNFLFTLPTSTTVKSIRLQYCLAASGSCVVPTGMTTTGGSLVSTSNLGTGTYTPDFTTNGVVDLSDTGHSGSPSAGSTINLSGIVNGSNANETFFVWIQTYANDNYTSPLDYGVVASSTTNSITVTASVDETFSFCTSTVAIPTDCTTAMGSNVSLGTLSPASASTVLSYIGASTNAGSGYGVTYTGNTLTSGANTITACAASCTSTPGTEQYGIKLAASGGGSGTVTPPYNGATYKFLSGDPIASASVATNYNEYTVTYLANISTVTEPGTYTSTVNYVGTPLY